MGRGKKPTRLLTYLALAAGVAVVAGCGQHAANTPPAQNLQSVQSASAPPQPYTVVAQLPTKPPVVEDHRRSLHLTYHDDRYYLADNSGDDYDCARDSHGNLYPAYYDREVGRYCPLYYDSDRDRYYCAVRDNGRFYRRYWDDPHDLYYDDQYDYDDYQPPAPDRPVIYIQKNYYNEYNYGSGNRSHHGHNNDALLAAIPIVAVAFVALSHTGHHDHPVLAAHNAPPRPAVVYRAAQPNQRPINISQRQTVVVQQAPPNHPQFKGNIPVAKALQHGLPPPGTRLPWHTAKLPSQPGQPAPVATKRQFFAHKQPAPRVAVKPAPRQMPVAAKPVAKPMIRAARPPQVPGKPRQMVKLPVGLHTHPMIPVGKPVATHTHPMIRAAQPGPRPMPKMAVHPGPRPMPKMAARPPAPPKPEVKVAPRPAQIQHVQRRPQAAPPVKVAMPAQPHPAPKIASHPIVAPKPAGPPAYHRMPQPPAQSAPAKKPASSSVRAWIPTTNHENPPANNQRSKHGGDKKNQQSGQTDHT